MLIFTRRVKSPCYPLQLDCDSIVAGPCPVMMYLYLDSDVDSNSFTICS